MQAEYYQNLFAHTSRALKHKGGVKEARGGRDGVILVVSASSGGYDGGNFAEITVNDAAVALEANENGHDRGLHMVLINAQSGKVELAQVFDTYQTSSLFDEFIATDLAEGLIIVAACKDDCISNLSELGKQFFAKLGSLEIYKLGYRCGFAFIGLSGMNEAVERRAKTPSEKVSATQVFEVDPDGYYYAENLREKVKDVEFLENKVSLENSASSLPSYVREFHYSRFLVLLGERVS